MANEVEVESDLQLNQISIREVCEMVQEAEEDLVVNPVVATAT